MNRVEIKTETMPLSDAADNIHNMDLAAEFAEFFNMVSWAVNANAREKGFWEASEEPGTKIALMHSELSEALEAVRKPTLRGHIDSHTLLEEELADVIIRIMDFAAGEELDVAGAIIEKARFNRTRPFMHGHKQF